MIGLVTCVVLVTAAIPSFALWPMPANMTQGDMGLKLAASFSFQLSGSLATTAPSDLKDAGKFHENYRSKDALTKFVPGI